MATPAMASSMSTLLATGAGASTFAVLRPQTAVLAPRRRTVVVRASQDKKNSGDGKVDALSHENSRESKVLDAVSLTGSAPEVERINGRLAMVGFVSALAVEASRGDGLLSQASSGSGLAWFAATVAIFSLASLVPLRKGERPQDRSGGIGGIWTADAEIWNGRAAMLGLVALAATEYMNGTPFISV